LFRYRVTCSCVRWLMLMNIFDKQTDNTDGTTRCKDVRNLSGGERSFTTLCLLLSLRHVVCFFSTVQRMPFTDAALDLIRLKAHFAFWTSMMFSLTRCHGRILWRR
jgi:hypothetical protein